MIEPSGGGEETARPEYAERLRRLEGARWKRVLNVQAPYRRNLRRLNLGRVLDVGCGVGRNLSSLSSESVGVDHNAEAVASARARGLTAYTPKEFYQSDWAQPEWFDTLLLAHVLEHLDIDAANRLLGEYLPHIRRAGQVVLITPQEAGFTTDPTHLRFVDDRDLAEHCNVQGLTVRRSYSFPFPRWAGRAFPYNEFVTVAVRE
jgi:2-polyprenyl-3-methyl-5-hydroxy-6-metoxy-1,4-benzoquinol methylase